MLEMNEFVTLIIILGVLALSTMVFCVLWCEERSVRKTLTDHLELQVERAIEIRKLYGAPSGIPETKEKVLDLSEGEKVWVIKAKFENGRMHTVQIASQEHYERIRSLDAVFYVQSKLSCRSDAEKLGSWVFLTREEAEEALKKINSP